MRGTDRYTMLIVDDEVFALKGISQGIDWTDLPVAEVREAGSAKAAIALMETSPIDLVVSDIEMPDVDGLSLLKWIRERSPSTLVIFLTAHARFDYAQEALKLGCFDYALKPIDHDLLKRTVARALVEIGEQRKRLSLELLVEQQQSQWKQELPFLIERFWQDVLARRTSLEPERLDRQFQTLGLDLTSSSWFLPILLSIERWDLEVSTQEEHILESAVRKQAQTLVVQGPRGVVFQDSGEVNLILLYGGRSPGERAAVVRRCQDLAALCLRTFHCRLSCYVGTEGPLEGLSDAVERLLHRERTGGAGAPQVVDTSLDHPLPKALVRVPGPDLGEWESLLEQGRTDDLMSLVTRAVRSSTAESISRESLEQVHHALMHLAYQFVHRRGLSLYEVLSPQELEAAAATRSDRGFLTWAEKVVGRLADLVAGENPSESSPIVERACDFIRGNLEGDLSRDRIAAHVGRNPAYLSRLFRKLTGLSLSDYIAERRIDRAKDLLVTTDTKVSSIAGALGYVHLSYFAKLFRKVTGLTPQDYRKKHRSP